LITSITYFCPQSSGRGISEHLHCWRTPVMLSHTEDFNPDYRVWRYGASVKVCLEALALESGDAALQRLCAIGDDSFVSRLKDTESYCS
ncbi:hypothetical protein GBF38_022862, partial [Nibea albiflora]